MGIGTWLPPKQAPLLPPHPISAGGNFTLGYAYGGVVSTCGTKDGVFG